MAIHAYNKLSRKRDAKLVLMSCSYQISKTDKTKSTKIVTVMTQQYENEKIKHKKSMRPKLEPRKVNIGQNCV